MTELRVCTKCQVGHDTSSFYRASPTRLHTICKTCHKRQSIDAMTRRLLADPEAYQEARRVRGRKTLAKSSVVKHCLQCAAEIKVQYKRRFERTKYCSLVCKGKYEGPRATDTIKALMAANKKPENVAKLKAAHVRGADHPSYIDGRGSSQRPKTPWRLWRVAVFERDNYTCQACGVRGAYLEADHIKPYSQFPEIAWDVSNGRTLCRPCHLKTSTFGRKQHARIRSVLSCEEAA